MASNDNDLLRSITCLRSSSPSMIIPKKSKTNSLLSSCCSCSRSPSSYKNPPSDYLLNPNGDNKLNVQRGFFKRIQSFKGLSLISDSCHVEDLSNLAQKRQSAARKQQLAAAAASVTSTAPTISGPTTIAVKSNDYSVNDNERLLTSRSELESSNVHPITHESICTTYSPRRIRNSHSIPLLNRHHDLRPSIQGLPTGIDAAYSFTDIEAASSTQDELNDVDKRILSLRHHQTSLSNSNTRQNDDDLPNGTPKSLPSRDFSSMATNLSAYSTQSLLRKLMDKAQVLNEYYNDVCHRPDPAPDGKYLTRKRSSSISTNSLLGRTGTTPRSLLHRDQSTDSMRKSRHKRPSLNENMSTDSSRFNLYADEDNVLKELIRFNNDIDLILSRLEMEGETVPTSINPSQQQSEPLGETKSSPTTPFKSYRDEIEPTESKLDDLKNLLQHASIYPSNDSGLAASPTLFDR